MKMFEEKWTAWLDDQLSGNELTQFEASLPDLEAARAEKREARKLGSFLKEQLRSRKMSNEEFFSHQVHEPGQDRLGGRFRAWFGAAQPPWRCSF